MCVCVCMCVCACVCVCVRVYVCVCVCEAVNGKLSPSAPPQHHISAHHLHRSTRQTPGCAPSRKSDRSSGTLSCFRTKGVWCICAAASQGRNNKRWRLPAQLCHSKHFGFVNCVHVLFCLVCAAGAGSILTSRILTNTATQSTMKMTTLQVHKHTQAKQAHTSTSTSRINRQNTHTLSLFLPFLSIWSHGATGPCQLNVSTLDRRI